MTEVAVSCDMPNIKKNMDSVSKHAHT